MRNVTYTASTDKWGKGTEKQLGADDDGSWKREMFTEKITWEYDRFRKLLKEYSNIHPDDIEEEIVNIRDKAWDVAKYPCIGSFTFVRLLEFSGSEPEMQKAIERLKTPGSQDTFLELGGFLCQTARQLVFEGIDSARLYGTDLHSEFVELGYELFRDRETLKSTLVAGDMLLPDEEYAASKVAKTLDGKISMVHAANFFHLFSWESQLVICQRIVRFFRRGSGINNSPAMLFGSHMGTINPGEIEAFGIFLHDEATFQSLWDEVGNKTATRWKVNMQIEPLTPPKPNFYGGDARVVHYVVTQLDY